MNFCTLVTILVILHNVTFYDVMKNVYGEQQYKTTEYSLSIESCNKNPTHELYGITYSGKRVRENYTVAVDPKVIPLGTWIIIDGHIYQAMDTGSGVRGRHIDIYVADDGQARRYGVQYNKIVIMR